MPTPKKRTSKRPKSKGKIVVKQKAELRKKEVQPKDSLKRVHSTLRDNGVSFKVKIRKK